MFGLWALHAEVVGLLVLPIAGSRIANELPNLFVLVVSCVLGQRAHVLLVLAPLAAAGSNKRIARRIAQIRPNLHSAHFVLAWFRGIC